MCLWVCQCVCVFDCPNVVPKQNLEPLTLKKPNEIYYEMYKEAKRKAIELRKEALDAFLKAKQIKNKYSLEESDDEEDDSEEDELNYLIDS